MTQYEGIRTASDIELNEAYRRLVAQGNSESAPLAKASRRWLASVCDEVNRRYPDEGAPAQLPVASGYWQNGCWVSTGDPGDECEA